MADTNNPLIPALAPLVSRVRTDVTAIRGATGAQAWTREPLTTEALARHLNGGPARGVCPIQAGSDVTLVALLDFDSHGGETSWETMTSVAGDVFTLLDLGHGCRPLCFRSSGGRGVHLYVLWDEPQDARSVRAWLRGVLAMCGLQPGVKGVAQGQVEVFPKQDRVPLNGYGNQFILPLAGKGELLEFCDLSVALVPAGRPLRAEDWQGSPAVPALPPAPVPEHNPDATPGTWGLALDAIVAGQARAPLSYDQWRDCIFAIHHETQGEGLALAHRLSAAAPSKYQPDFLDTRVWPFIRSDGRDAVVTGRTLMSVAKDAYGWTEPLDPAAFPVVPELTPAPAAAGAPAQPEKRVPRALSLCTDQRNAERLERRHRGAIMTQAGRWFGWTGKVWEETERDIYTKAMGLSAAVRAELNEEEKTLAELCGGSIPDISSLTVLRSLSPEQQAQALVVKGLRAWQVKCEGKPTIDAAVGLLKKLTEVQAEDLDAQPLLLNCANGVLDLATGQLHAHDPALRMTRIVPYAYDPDADTRAWENTLAEIVGADLVPFMARWAGYCLTGSTREQAFLVHFGAGSNGKSLVVEVLSRLMGSYASAAPTGLVAGSARDAVKDTDLASLRGRRMVTAHEAREGVDLREDVVKMITGSDRISGRKLYGDSFDFTPTHKLQLLTNHKPTIRGQDHGIWRRVVLVEYGETFGDVVGHVHRSGSTVTRVADKDRLARLTTPEGMAGVLAWAVRGCQDWLARGGLDIPDRVSAAGADYQTEQDRVGQFLAQCCEMDRTASEPLTLGMGGLYPAYVQWCKEAGYFALGRNRFVSDLKNKIPGWNGTLVQATERSDTGGRRKVSRVPGVRLLLE